MDPITADQLALFNGKDGQPMCLAVLGHVFEITGEGKKFYEKPPYSIFIGRDGSRAFATGQFTPEGAIADVSGLDPQDLEAIQQWIEKYQQKYTYRGTLVGTYFDSEGNPTQAGLTIQQNTLLYRRKEHPNKHFKLDFVVKQNNLKRYNFQSSEIRELEEGEILLRINKFGMTSNNITLATLGSSYRYFDFFPTTPGLGIIPVWALAEVIASKHPKVPIGENIYGYFPFSTHLILQPSTFSGGSFYVKRPHLPPDRKVYNQYYITNQDPFYKRIHEDEMLIFRPLFFTSFFLEDYLAVNHLFGAKKVIILSASSKTAVGLAFLLHRQDIEVIGITAAVNEEYVSHLGYYSQVHTYDQLDQIHPSQEVVVVDMSANRPALNKLYEIFGEKMKLGISVGMTHWEEKQKSIIPQSKFQLFFAPYWIKHRQEELGFALVEKMKLGWNLCLQNSHKWTRVRHGAGLHTVVNVYRALFNGEVDPETAWILSVDGENDRAKL